MSCAATVLAGCGDGNFEATLDAGVRNLFTPRRTPQQHMILAVSSEDPDVRRDSVARIAKSKKYNQEWAIKGFIAIALLESNPQTRCVAIRALTRTGDPRAIETALKILHHEDYPPREIWPPVALCRWDATKALADLSARGQVPGEYREAVLETLQERLHSDTGRHARIAAARGLGYYKDEAVVGALIEGLRDRDFAVVHRCEDSLVKLTGHTHNCNAGAWEEWVQANREHLFDQTGHIPESRRPLYRTRWGKMVHETKELLVWLWPGSKE